MLFGNRAAHAAISRWTAPAPPCSEIALALTLPIPLVCCLMRTNMNHPSKLSPAFSGTLRTFSYWIAAGSVRHPLLEGIEYRQIMLAEPSLTEGAYAIFANVIEFDQRGMPVNAKYAEHRTAQWIQR